MLGCRAMDLPLGSASLSPGDEGGCGGQVWSRRHARDDDVMIEQVFGYCSPRTTTMPPESTGLMRGGDRCQWSGIPSLVSPGEGTSPKLTSHARRGCAPP